MHSAKKFQKRPEPVLIRDCAPYRFRPIGVQDLLKKLLHRPHLGAANCKSRRDFEISENRYSPKEAHQTDHIFRGLWRRPRYDSARGPAFRNIRASKLAPK